VRAVYNRVHRMPFGELSAVYYKHGQTARRKLTVYRLIKGTLMNGMPRSSKSPLPRRLISAYAEGDLSDLILGQRRIASFIIRDKQSSFDLFGSHPAPAHRSGQVHQCVVALAFRDGSAYRRDPVRAWFLRISQQLQEPPWRIGDRRAVPPAVPLPTGMKRGPTTIAPPSPLMSRPGPLCSYCRELTTKEQRGLVRLLNAYLLQAFSDIRPKGDEPMKRFLLIPILIMTAASLALSQTPSVETKTKGNPLVGAWKANLEKSQRDPNHQFQSLTMRFEVSDEAMLLTFSGVNMAGKQESGTRKLRPDGKEYPIAEAPGVVEITKWVGSHTLELVAKKDGKVVGESTYEVSKDGKTLTSKVRGTDAKGRQFEQVIVVDRE
jgi:hypothetical protein